MSYSIWIPGNVPSSKNSKRIVSVKDKLGNKRTLIINSKTTEAYIKATEWIWKAERKNIQAFLAGKEKPYRASFKFYRNSKRIFDYINPMQTVQDLMVRYEWIEDDNADILLPVIEPYEYSKTNPGIKITFL